MYVLQLLFFFFSTVMKSYKGDFKASDLWEQTVRLKSDSLAQLLETKWQAEVEQCTSKK